MATLALSTLSLQANADMRHVHATVVTAVEEAVERHDAADTLAVASHVSADGASRAFWESPIRSRLISSPDPSLIVPFLRAAEVNELTAVIVLSDLRPETFDPVVTARLHDAPWKLQRSSRIDLRGIYLYEFLRDDS